MKMQSKKIFNGHVAMMNLGSGVSRGWQMGQLSPPPPDPETQILPLLNWEIRPKMVFLNLTFIRGWGFAPPPRTPTLDPPLLIMGKGPTKWANSVADYVLDLW